MPSSGATLPCLTPWSSWAETQPDKPWHLVQITIYYSGALARRRVPDQVRPDGGDSARYFIVQRAFNVSQPIRNAPCLRTIFTMFDCFCHFEFPSTRRNSSSSLSRTCGYFVSICGLC